ncbi:deoxyribodipyrimidine photo-lyase [Haloechinothrix sp. LS1_15]|uniref:cryptochrome/photolyase family protein n=1 Tax=Haloechinothrix sp. LS1_15 TaxID=2652248 RepID=UPI002948006D|nr:deoxyribodipyrimidine photo-lyase [Haloechinothrix sp. LS1_15]MDV6014338.1 deoxyribodipyrimidine photo-lyase [Haloechinothrix sp. LS1_15]
MVTDEVAVLWFRRDLRLHDHPALLAATRQARHVLALYVLDDALLERAGAARVAFAYRCLRELDRDLDGRLLIVRGDPARVVPEVARACSASTVHITADNAPYGRTRDGVVARELTRLGIELKATGSPYAVTPGRVCKDNGQPYRVFTPFSRAWSRHGWPSPAPTGVDSARWFDPSDLHSEVPGIAVPDEPDLAGMRLPTAGERAAHAVWQEFLATGVTDYAERRDRPDRPGTTRLSVYLRWGCIHPRTLLADLSGISGEGAAAFRSELAWREFHADVLWHHPDAARQNLDRRFDRMRHDSGPQAQEAFDAWCAGCTGYPVVDAGMRQLRTEGWMHNRIRMVAASFLVKDLHLPWQWGARHFMRYLVDGDLASNQLNWQWVAGSGSDAAPYFRIFNPTIQGKRFDPEGEFVRTYVPELRGLPGSAVHTPWRVTAERRGTYPLPIVEHDHERREALRRYAELTSAPGAAQP